MRACKSEQKLVNKIVGEYPSPMHKSCESLKKIKTLILLVSNARGYPWLALPGRPVIEHNKNNPDQ